MGAELGNRSRSLLSQAGSSGLTSGSARETLSGPIKCTRRRSNGWCVSPKQSQRVPAIQPRIVLARDALQGGRIPREISDELFHNAPLFEALVPASFCLARILDNCEIQDLFPLLPRKRSKNAVSPIEAA